LPESFLLLVGCIVVVLLVSLFGWARNAWLNHQIESYAHQRIEHAVLLDSLRPLTSPTKHQFIDLFDSAYVAQHAQLLLTAPAWTKGLDPFRELNRVYVAQLANTLNSTGYLNRSTSTRLESISEEERSIIDLGRELKALYPSEFGSMADKVVGIAAVNESPVAFSSVNTLGNPFWQFKPETEKSIALCSEQLRRLLLESVNATSDSQFDQGVFVAKLPDGTLVRFPSEMSVSEVVDVIVGMESREAIISAQQLSKAEGLAMLKETKRLWTEARKDSSLQSPSYLLARVLIGEPSPRVELQMAYDYLTRNDVLNCAFNDLLFTMQRKPVPPMEEKLDAFSKHMTIVDELHKAEFDNRARLWNTAEQWAAVKWATLVVLVLVYPLRLLVLGTRWALRTLKA
jgi:hypothetical protein